MFYVYALKSISHNYIYVGLTNNAIRRVTQHNHGKERTTRHYRPFKLLRTWEFATRAEARKFEKYLKTCSGKEKLRDGMADLLALRGRLDSKSRIEN